MLGSPLRPAGEDVAMIEEAARSISIHAQHARPLHALLLGVTPEIAAMNWPLKTFLSAADREQGMIAGVWPGDTPSRAAVCADWLSLPFADGVFDLVVGDGCLVLLEYGDGYRRFAESVRRCMTREGRLMLRIFCRPEHAETLDDIAEALDRRAIGSFDAFKWRLAMAVQRDDIIRGAPLDEVWRAWNVLVPDLAAFARYQGWPLEKVLVIDAYRDNPTKYYFPSLAEVRASFGTVFEQVSSRVGRYELAERCPHVVFQPR